MAWKTIDAATSTTWKYQESALKEFIGVYLGKKEHVGPNDSTIFEFEYAGEDQLEFKKGETVGVWSNTQLNTKLSTLQAGELVKLTYKGKAVGKKGTKYHDFEVQHDVA